MYAYRNPKHPGNSKKHRTGRRCITKWCFKPAGTIWSPLWCFECNVKQMDHVNNQLEEIVRKRLEKNKIAKEKKNENI